MAQALRISVNYRQARGEVSFQRQVVAFRQGFHAGGSLLAASAEQLTGRGVIGGYPVRCIPPEWLVTFHTGYELDDNDWHDVRRLCERFQIAVPDEYLKFRK